MMMMPELPTLSRVLAWHNFEIGVWVSFVQDDKATRVELFPDDQLDAAVDRFAQLNQSTPHAP